MSAEVITDNRSWAGAAPRLSVLIPFHRESPSRLLRALADAPAPHDVEIIVLDDGSGDGALSAEVGATVSGLSLPARLITLGANVGRARGRNRLTKAARGAWLLFIDADMLPDRGDFLGVWTDLIARENPAVAFGGLSVAQAPRRPEVRLHRRMALQSDCIDLDRRRRAPEKHVFTSNLLVRRDVFAAEPFDSEFAGWGWEDVEWAMRVSRRWPIIHIDNPATHLGLDTAEVLVRKYEQSAGNFAKVVEKHRDIVSRYPSYRAARALRRVPALGALRASFRRCALSPLAPLSARALAMRLFRAALYAEAVS